MASNSTARKDSALAGILSFLVNGAGQIYVGDTQRGVLILIIQLLQFIFGYFIYITFLTFFVVYIWCIFDAVKKAHEHNASIDSQERFAKERIAAEESRRVRASQEKSRLEKQSQMELVKSGDFATSIKKNHELFTHKLLTNEEFAKVKTNLIDGLRNKTISESTEDFLFNLIPLLEANILSDEDMQNLKGIVLFRGIGTTQNQKESVGVPKESSSPKMESQLNDRKNSVEDPQGLWTCPKCRTENGNSTYKCNSCGYSVV